MTKIETYFQRAYRAIEAGIQAIDAELAAAEKSVDASEDFCGRFANRWLKCVATWRTAAAGGTMGVLGE